MFFWAVVFTGAALGNSIDYLLWVSETALFKQNMLTNLIFVFSLILSFPGIYFLAQVCQVRITRQPILYFLPFVVTFAIIPIYMNLEILRSIFNAGNIENISKIPNLKEFLFGVIYSLVGGYLSSVSLFIWQTGKGRLVHSARLIAVGTVIFSFGCSIYAGLFPSVPLLYIPGNPVHILIALGYVLVALGIRRTQNTIKTSLQMEENRLTPVVTLTEMFRENEGLAVYQRLENHIRTTLLQLTKSREFSLNEILNYIRSISNAQQRTCYYHYTEIIPDESVKIAANRQVLQQIITNLLVNAFKFCNQTSVTLEITQSASDLKTVVSDQGIGISEDQQQKIFDAFYQVSLGTKRKYGGIGLGLSIVKKLVTWLNGNMNLKSAPDQGSRFEVTLPIVVD